MRTDPRVKLLALLLLTTLALLFDRAWWLLGLLAVTLVLALACGCRLSVFFRRIRAFVGLLLAVALLQCLFTRGGEALLTAGDTVLVYRAGAEAGVRVGLRFLVVICGAALLTAESSRRLIAGLSGLKLPYTLVFMLMTSLRFLPLFRSSFQDALISVQLRGVELRAVPAGKRLAFYGSLLLPVLSEAIERSRQLALAMEARGFGAYSKRTCYFQVKMMARDWLLTAGLTAGFAAALCFYF